MIEDLRFAVNTGNLNVSNFIDDILDTYDPEYVLEALGLTTNHIEINKLDQEWLIEHLRGLTNTGSYTYAERIYENLIK